MTDYMVDIDVMVRGAADAIEFAEFVHTGDRDKTPGDLGLTLDDDSRGELSDTINEWRDLPAVDAILNWVIGEGLMSNERIGNVFAYVSCGHGIMFHDDLYRMNDDLLQALAAYLTATAKHAGAWLEFAGLTPNDDGETVRIG